MILAGIAGAMGPNEKKNTPMGTIVIAEKIIDYEPSKIKGKSLEPRGKGVNCDLFPDMKEFLETWNESDVALKSAKSSRSRAIWIYFRKVLKTARRGNKRLFMEADVDRFTQNQLQEQSKRVVSGKKTVEQRAKELLDKNGDLKKVHCGYVLSGDKLVASKLFKRQLRIKLGVEEQNNLRAVEMEAGGVLKAIQSFPSSVRPAFGMIRGICDDASVGKDDEWHGIASDNATTFAIEFIVWHASQLNPYE